MQFSNVSLPEIYKSSQDFRFFIEWFSTCLEKLKYDHEAFIDLYDPLRCPDNLLWCLADTLGFKYDDRLPVSFNRLVLVYFMSMIRLKGSKDGIMLAAQVNLAQHKIVDESILGYYEEDENHDKRWVAPKPILQSRLEDTNIPFQSVYVTPHTEEGYIEVVYFTNRKTIDACIEYVRPLGMYIYQFEGVKFETRTRISIDGKLSNTRNLYTSIGPTHVGHYSREDYARLQEIKDRLDVEHVAGQEAANWHVREPVWYRNSESEGEKSKIIPPGVRALYSLQLANNDHAVNSLIRDPETNELNPPDTIFGIGYNPIDVDTSTSKPIWNPEYADKPLYNLRYDAGTDKEITEETYVNDPKRNSTITNPKPAVNPVMLEIGDAITHTQDNTLYSETDNEFTEKVKKK